MKKATSLFKSVVSKSKSMFGTKKQAAPPQNKQESDEEDNDLIEIGKTHKTTASTF